VKSRLLGSAQISPITQERPAHLTPSSIAHSASRASRASTWMRFHALLHPQQGLGRVELREEEPCPAAIARVRGEQLGQGRGERRGQAPALARPTRERTPPSRSGARKDSSAGDQRQTSCHTTHNVSVLLLFYVPRLRAESQACDSKPVRPFGPAPRSSPRAPPSDAARADGLRPP
jgi:hypothetical protein